MDTNETIYSDSDGVENASEGQTALDSDDSLPINRRVRSIGKRPRLHLTSLSPTSDDESHLPLTALARKRSSIREAASREKALEAEVLEVEEGRRAMGVDVGDVRTVEALGVQVAKDVDIILKVATRSTNLKGTFVKALKNAASSISIAVESLKERTSSDEVRKLQAENTRLRRDVEELKLQMAELAKNRPLQPVSGPAQDTHSETDREERMRASLLSAIKEMLDSRLADIEKRLPPAKTVRPPLAADATGVTLQEPPPAKKKKAARKAKAATVSTAPATAVGDAKVTQPRDDEWVAVVKKKKKGKDKSSASGAAAAKSSQQRKKTKSKKKAKSRRPRLVAPRRPAVIITLEPEAEEQGVTYSHLLKRAAETLNLADLGISEGLNVRTAATGGRLLELAKGQTSEAAQRLAQELDRVLEGTARVVQPMKLASLRVSGLDDSVTKQMVAEAAAKATKCDVGVIKTGEVTTGPGGMGASILRCPIPAAKALAQAGRLLVGWSSARVTLLEQRPLRCFKCMGIGHTRPTCPFAVDRSGLCYRCGKEGHIAKNCTEAPKCAVCTSAGKPASHIMGGRVCRPPKVRRMAVGRAPPPNSRKAAEEAAAMSS
ncbi:uncharacterized protein LOC123666487 [Melitaea cinxia]|uniref:uncharacterized protein LOC123666487 n=1 Tax=Melitaea cinxia TaxID=113334 RepID=UPI001E271B0E|nr:uncharacterized protein LOC123666487 [Melitaea cinxia]